MNIPTSLFKRDAMDFCDMQAPTGCEARAKAAAALLGIPFVGMGMGLRCSSRHEEDVRAGGEADGDEEDNKKGKKTRQPPISRYTFIAPGSTEGWPQVQFGTEEIMDSTMTSVVAIGVWIFVYDETYSTTALIASVMEGLRKAAYCNACGRISGRRA